MLRRPVLILVMWTIPFWAVSSIQGGDCLARGAYFGQTLPGSTPQVFAPGIASTEHHDDWIPVFSPSGREVILRINGSISGEVIGVLFWSAMDETDCWSVPVPLPFSGRFMDGAVVFSPDGSRIYFSSKRPDPGEIGPTETSRVWRVAKGDKGWDAPTLLDSPINQHNVNGGLSIAADGTLYVALKAPTGAGELDIYELAPDGDSYPTLETVRGPINTEGIEVAPYIDPEERFLIYTSLSSEAGMKTLMSRRQADSSWGPPQPIPMIIEFESKFVGLSPNGEVLFFVSHRQVDESNPKAIWDLDLFDGLAIEENADRYWVDSSIVREVFESQ